LDEEDTGQRITDDSVLLALDCGDDVSHSTGTRASERGEQRAWATEGETTFDEALLRRGTYLVLGQGEIPVGVGEVLIFDARDVVTLNSNVAASRESERFNAGRSIKRLGDGRAPVNDERVQLIVRYGQATNVVLVALPHLVGCVINASEEQGLVADRELIEAVQCSAHDHVTFDEVAGAAHIRNGCTVAQRAGFVTHVIECPQGEIEEYLFFLDLTLVRHCVLSHFQN
jgi:hypothetical protein